MIQNLNEKPVSENASVADLQELFEKAVAEGVLFDDLELSEDMYFKHKDRQGNYRCATTLAVFKMFCLGYDKGFEKGSENNAAATDGQ